MTTDLLIPNYNILRTIGEGGMATVYLGEHARLGNKVAIKVLNSHYVRHEQVRSRFLTEAKVLASFQHSHIVGVKDFFEEGDVLAFVMDYVEGLPLDEYLYTHNALRDPSKAIAFFSQMLDAFSYAHQKGVVHRDIKPGNLMVTQDGQVRVLDFGIAKLLETPVGAAKATATGTMLGTPMYMSPEQINLKPGESIDHRSDIYALGVTLHQILSGRPPYDADTHSGFEMQLKIMTEPLPRLEQVPEWLQKVVDKATAKKREDRFQSCNDFLQALKRETPSSKVEQPVFKPVYNETPRVEAKTVVSTPDQQKTQVAAAAQATQILEKPLTTQFFSPAAATKAVEQKAGLDLNKFGREPKKKSNSLYWIIAILVVVIGGFIWGSIAMSGNSPYSDSETIISDETLVEETIIEDTTAIEVDTTAVPEEVTAVEEPFVVTKSVVGAAFEDVIFSISGGFQVHQLRRVHGNGKRYKAIVGDINGDGLQDGIVDCSLMTFSSTQEGVDGSSILVAFINTGKALVMVDYSREEMSQGFVLQNIKNGVINLKGEIYIAANESPSKTIIVNRQVILDNNKLTIVE
ncbi:serine/threonine-protein kinase [uncultured Pontibacter sp.]|uniref:serine/threonine protein kinase n=1 Tax=uncultured Pontibacter sp. TaxID=453356 RepID=UPI002604E9E6|nr:serine/threonine-protein kinase [uncultured Pontibacter sp.]